MFVRLTRSSGDRSEIVESRELEWAEWVRMRDPKAVKTEFEKYWYDTVRLKSQWEKPDFAEHLKGRLRRSKMLRDMGDWQQYEDPVFKKGFVFWYSRLTRKLRVEDPFV